MRAEVDGTDLFQNLNKLTTIGWLMGRLKITMTTIELKVVSIETDRYGHMPRPRGQPRPVIL